MESMTANVLMLSGRGWETVPSERSPCFQPSWSQYNTSDVRCLAEMSSSVRNWGAIRSAVESGTPATPAAVTMFSYDTLPLRSVPWIITTALVTEGYDPLSTRFR